MANCKFCGAEVTFAPHPNNPDKMAPFDMNGEIHFASCTKKQDKPKRVYTSFADIDAVTAGSINGPVKYVHWLSTAAGDRLRATSATGHLVTFIPNTPENEKLINAPRDYHQVIFDKRNEEYARGRYGHQTPKPPRSSRKFSSSSFTMQVFPPAGGNNSDDAVFVVKGDQFNCSEFKMVEDGFALKIYGNWEFSSLLEMLAQAAVEFGADNVEKRTIDGKEVFVVLQEVVRAE